MKRGGARCLRWKDYVLWRDRNSRWRGLWQASQTVSTRGLPDLSVWTLSSESCPASFSGRSELWYEVGVATDSSESCDFFAEGLAGQTKQKTAWQQTMTAASRTQKAASWPV